MTKTFILILAILLPSGDLQPWRTLTLPLPLRECEQLKDNRTLQVSYLADAWYGEKLPDNVVLACVPYKE